jgi:hypothetical protein
MGLAQELGLHWRELPATLDFGPEQASSEPRLDRSKGALGFD